MTKEKIISLIKKRISDEEKEYQRELELHHNSERYAQPNYSWFYGRIRAFREALELIGMLDKENNL